MTTIAEMLDERGYTPAEIAELEPLLEAEAERRSVDRAAEVLARIRLRMDKDSIEGRARARVWLRVMGGTNDVSLERAASDFGVTKQYLHDLERAVEAEFAELAAFVSQVERRSPVAA